MKKNLIGIICWFFLAITTSFFTSICLDSFQDIVNAKIILSNCSWDCTSLTQTVNPVYDASTDTFNLIGRITCNGDILGNPCPPIDLTLGVYKYVSVPWPHFAPINITTKHVNGGTLCGASASLINGNTSFKFNNGAGTYYW